MEVYEGEVGLDIRLWCMRCVCCPGSFLGGRKENSRLQGGERGQAQTVTAFDVTRRSASAVSVAGLFFCHSSMRMSVRQEHLASKRLWVLTV